MRRARVPAIGRALCCLRCTALCRAAVRSRPRFARVCGALTLLPLFTCVACALWSLEGTTRAVAITELACHAQIYGYNGSAIVAMAGEKCVAIGSDLRFGVQMQTMATDHQKLAQARMTAHSLSLDPPWACCLVRRPHETALAAYDAGASIKVET